MLAPQREVDEALLERLAEYLGESRNQTLRVTDPDSPGHIFLTIGHFVETGHASFF